MENLSDIRERIQGKRVVSVGDAGSTLLLDDGTVLRLYMSASDCCASAEGDWVIQPDSLDAIITDVKFDLLDDDDEPWDSVSRHAKITILHNQNPVALADCYAGHNGYYYAALSLNVTVPGGGDFDTEVVSA